MRSANNDPIENCEGSAPHTREHGATMTRPRGHDGHDGGGAVPRRREHGATMARPRRHDGHDGGGAVPRWRDHGVTIAATVEARMLRVLLVPVLRYYIAEGGRCLETTHIYRYFSFSTGTVHSYGTHTTVPYRYHG
jgi:hypothetical protein